MANAPNYPGGFPDELKPMVTAADAEARRIFRKAAEELRRAPGFDYNDIQLKALFKNRALAIASVATQQLCAAVKAGSRRAHSAHDDLEHLFADCIRRTNWDAREFASRKLSDDQEYALRMDLETTEEYVQHVKAITEAGSELPVVASPAPPPTSGRTKVGNPILEEIHSQGNDPETLRALVENGGQGLSAPAQKALRMAGQILREGQPSSPKMPEGGARSSEKHIETAPQPPIQDPIDSFKLPPELCSLLSAADQDHLVKTIIDVDIRLFKDDVELERLRIRGGHLWPVFSAIAAPLQDLPNFRDTVLREFIPQMVEQIRKDMKWYPVFGILDNDFYLAPCIREWRHAPKKMVGGLDQSGEFLVETGPQHAEQGAVVDVRTTDQSPKLPAGVAADRDEPSDQKGDLKLLQKIDGSLYESVAFLTAEAYADISDRRRQQLMGDGTLNVVGKGQNRRITVESLVAYCPPIEKAK